MAQGNMTTCTSPAPDTPGLYQKFAGLWMWTLLHATRIYRTYVPPLLLAALQCENTCLKLSLPVFILPIHSRVELVHCMVQYLKMSR